MKENPPVAPRLSGLVLAALPSAVVVHDAAGRAVFANPRAAALLGIEPGSILGRRPLEYLADHPDAARIVSKLIDPATAAGPGSQDLSLTLAGQEQTLVITNVPLLDPESGARYWVLIIDDLGGHQGEANSRLTQAHTEKMAALGDLLSGVAHEINTPLGALNSNHDVFVRSTAKLKAIALRMEGEPRQALDRFIQVFEDLNRVNADALRRVLKLVGGLRSFARREEASEVLNLHDRIEDNLALIEHQTKNRIEVIREYDAGIPGIVCYPNLLSQALLNILVNAVHAIEGRGRITIRTRSAHDGIRIEITDTGSGIPAEILNRIFEPGFTTKGPGSGTGLGLPISRRNIERFGGRIEVESQVGKGSTFRIILPPECAAGSAAT
jgi:signal transduction histidine kinase